MELWIARDDDMEQIWSVSTECGKSYRLDSDLFPEVTFENSPRKVKIELI